MFNFFKKNYWAFLVLTILISYGQMLGMQPWEDDNALFIKLAHVNDRVGYFGSGPLGEGVYKYAAVPFIPIYHFFGYNTVAYFALLIFLYILATITIYKVLSYVLGEKAGRVSGFLFAAGYITSDSFWRMANSATTSISIIIISLFIGAYYKYFRERKDKWYFITLFLYFLAVQYSVVRDHYLFAMAVFFELIFLTFKSPLKSVFNSFIRLIPFSYIFLRFVIFSGDARTGGVKDYILSVVRGNYNLTSGFFASVYNLIIPNYVTDILFELQRKAIILFQFEIPIVKSIVWLVPILTLYLLFKSNRYRKRLLAIYCFALISWVIFANHIFLSYWSRDGFSSTFGGVLILLMTAVFFLLKKTKKIFALFSLWILVNVFAYSSSFPTIQFETINRYLAHSFFALTAVFGILYSEQNYKTRLGKFVTIAIIIYGLSNIFNTVIYQHKILINRSFPVKNFYQDLKTKLPRINNGDVLYFDVSHDAQGYYRDAISAAMIPDSGSFGWRYGIDRYDFNLTSNFNELSKLVNEGGVNSDSIHSFWYSKNGLVDTSENTRKYFTNNLKSFNILNTHMESNAQLTSKKVATNWSQPDLTFNFIIPPIASTPLGLDLTITAKANGLKENTFPIFYGNNIPDKNSPWKDESQKNLSLKYKSEMKNFISHSIFEVDSTWQDRTIKNLYDDDFDTVWQPDRVLWQARNNYIKVSLPLVEEVNKVVWVNSNYNNSIPISYNIYVSLDNISWTLVKKIEGLKFRGDSAYQIISFDDINAKYVKMVVTDTLGGDSPMVAEFRVIPSSLSGLDLNAAKKFINDPYLYVTDISTFIKTLNFFSYKIPAKLYWYGNQENNWLTSKNNEFEIIFDGKPHVYKFILPAGGTAINKIKISDIKIPSNIILSNIKYHALNNKDIN